MREVGIRLGCDDGSGSLSSLGNLLRTYRISRRLRQQDLGARVYLDHSVISRIESGARVPEPVTLVRIAEALQLRESERKLLFTAYEREIQQRWKLEADVSLRSEEVLDVANGHLTQVRQLRLCGQPQPAAAVASGSADWLRLVARRASRDIVRAFLLEALADAIAEECQCYLDYLRSEEAEMHLSGPRQELASIARMLSDRRVDLLHSMVVEGSFYLAGRYPDAIQVAGRFLDQTDLDPVWQPELLRAVAIDAAYLTDNDLLDVVESHIARVLSTREDLSDLDRSLLLEGVAQGQAAVGLHTALSSIERAWEHMSAAEGRDDFSALRAVQLTRTHLKANRALGIPFSVGDLRLAEDGLNMCIAGGFSRHHREIANLLDGH